jgi:hypothetical protein
MLFGGSGCSDDAGVLQIFLDFLRIDIERSGKTHRVLEEVTIGRHCQNLASCIAAAFVCQIDAPDVRDMNADLVLEVLARHVDEVAEHTVVIVLFDFLVGNEDDVFASHAEDVDEVLP